MPFVVETDMVPDSYSLHHCYVGKIFTRMAVADAKPDESLKVFPIKCCFHRLQRCINKNSAARGRTDSSHTSKTKLKKTSKSISTNVAPERFIKITLDVFYEKQLQTWAYSILKSYTYLSSQTLLCKAFELDVYLLSIQL